MTDFQNIIIQYYPIDNPKEESLEGEGISRCCQGGGFYSSIIMSVVSTWTADVTTTSI